MRDYPQHPSKELLTKKDLNESFDRIDKSLYVLTALVTILTGVTLILALVRILK